jgi:hypothetical protein
MFATSLQMPKQGLTRTKSAVIEFFKHNDTKASRRRPQKKEGTHEALDPMAFAAMARSGWQLPGAPR